MNLVRVATIGAVLLTTSSVKVTGGPMSPGEPLPGQALGTSRTNKPVDKQPDQEPSGPMTERQKQFAADTDKLFALATDLKEQVAKSTKNTLSVGVIKKADEIEKLAHTMKERMR
ncbi:MAG TPA: hypothetical protein VNU92_17925 [Edaphobacter sp.]|jgi:hypothetical protein|nr:hypothetical protein [Edaphobacter sp.]